MARNTWWVEYEFSYDAKNYEGEWENYTEVEAGRFNCVKKDIKKEVKKYLEEEILDTEEYKNLKIKIIDQYITTDYEV